MARPLWRTPEEGGIEVRQALQHIRFLAEVVDIPDLSGYFLLAGRAGGQTGHGGSAASENLILGSTGHATKGYVRIQSGSDLDLQANAIVNTGGSGIALGNATTAAVLSSVTTTQRDALTAAVGMLVYNTTTGRLEQYDGSWGPVGTGAGTQYGLVGGFGLAMGTPAKTGTDLSIVIIVPDDATIIKVWAYAKTGPTGAHFIVDINLNGTSIWNATQANRLKIVYGAVSGNETSFDTTALTAGDRLTIDIDQIGSTIAGQDITIEFLATAALSSTLGNANDVWQMNSGGTAAEWGATTGTALSVRQTSPTFKTSILPDTSGGVIIGSGALGYDYLALEDRATDPAAPSGGVGVLYFHNTGGVLTLKMRTATGTTTIATLS